MNLELMDATSAPVNVAAAASNELVAGRSGLRLVLLGGFLVCNAAVVATFEDSTGVDVSGPMSFAANGGCVLPPAELGYAVLPVGRGLHLLLGGAVQVSGLIRYGWVNG